MLSGLLGWAMLALSVPLAVGSVAVSCASRPPPANSGADNTMEESPVVTNGWSWTNDGDAPVSLLYHGSVRDVIAGQLTVAADRRLSAADFHAAFELGSPLEVSSMGEFVAINGVAYARSTDPTSPHYYEVVSGPTFVTTGAAFIPVGTRATWQLKYSAQHGGVTPSVQDLHRELLSRSSQAVCYVGLIQFAEYHAMAIAKSPIFQESIFEHKADYYARAITMRSDTSTAVMGCVARFGAIGDAALVEGLGRVLYYNPLAPPKGDVSAHTHALVLNAPVPSINAVTPAQVSGVDHLLFESRIQACDLEVYAIDKLEPAG